MSRLVGYKTGTGARDVVGGVVVEGAHKVRERDIQIVRESERRGRDRQREHRDRQRETERDSETEKHRET